MVNKVAFAKLRKVKLTKLKTICYLPTFWKKVLLKSKGWGNYLLIYLISDLYFFKLVIKLDSTILTLDNNSNNIVFKNYFEPFFKAFFLKNLKILFQSFSYWFFTKIKVKGKGYYLYKNARNTITHQLGHSHRRYLYSYFVFIKFLSKTTLYLAGLSKNDIFLAGRNIQKSKYINIFTGRGVRFAKQRIYKKTGKVSTYR